MRRLGSPEELLDAIDAKILRVLSEDGRITMTALARRVQLSAPSVTERVRRLEESNVIRGYQADINPEALGLAISAYIHVRPIPGQLHRVAALLDEISAVVECDRVTGDDCFVARVHVRSVKELESVIDQILPYGTTGTSIIQSSTVRRRLPLLPAPGLSTDGRTDPGRTCGPDPPAYKKRYPH